MSSTRVAWRCGIFLGWAGLWLGTTANFAEAARPTAAKLLPADTLAYVAVPDTQGLVDSFWQTALGRMSQDPQMKPLVGRLSAAVIEATGQMKERIGLSLDELLKIPDGEAALALVPQKDSRPALVVIVDIDETSPAIDKLLEAGTKAVEASGGSHETETVDGTKLEVFRLPGTRERVRACFVRDGALVGGSSLAAVKDVLSAWDAEPETTFADNTEFATISRSLADASGGAPHVLFYVDPLEIVRSSTQGNTAAQMGLALLPVVGLDGVQAIGGGVTFARGAFDQVTQLHLLLDQPRGGVVEALALQTGEPTPERWVPKEAANYSTLYWDIPKTYEKLAVVIDSFQGEGAFRTQVGRILGQNGIDFETELFPDLAGRYSLVTVIEQPPTSTSRAHLLGVKLKDTAAFRKVVEKLVAEEGEEVTKKSYGSQTYHVYSPEGPAPADPKAFRVQPSVCILGDYLLIADRPSLIEQAIRTESDPSLSLADSLEFKLVSSKAERQSKGPMAFFQFNQPEEDMRLAYGLLTGEGAWLKGMGRMAEQNPFMGNVNRALQEHPLPPFAVLAQYLAPGGSFIVDDETGLHYTSFTLRRDAP